MTIRIATAVIATTFIVGCSQGQKERVALINEVDSVSYAIGADIGANFKRSKLDNVNLEALSMGLRDGIDSMTTLTPEEVEAVIKGYMMKMQEEKMAEERIKGEANRVAGETFLAENGKKNGVTTTPSGLQYEVIKTGTGPKPLTTDMVNVHYSGTLIGDSIPFDSSIERGTPATFALDGGPRSVIPGMIEALTMMPVGSKWRVFIPSDLAYGSQARPGSPIPANSVLIFELDLLEIAKK
ncbi:MAG: FKBP-type peptidyl-prolyl cis-trans isomerase [Flavobacteriales bacterium]|nr:FKBP-type peptidyl-prolyl cis-trans isomerase [Flavobacteriales bacterium]